MKKEITDEQLIAFIEGQPDVDLERRIRADQDLQRRYDELKEVVQVMAELPDADVPLHIAQGVQEAIFREQAKSPGRFSWMQIAAAIALLVVGFGAGRFSMNSTGSEELVDLKNEIQSLKEVTLTSALQQYSASERIMAVSQIESVDKINPELIIALINTLNSDESPNVRYASLQALKKYIDHNEVRAELVKSLENQSDPLIQISLISILVEAEERSAIAPLRDIIKQKELTPEVKQQAQLAIEVLT